MKNCIIYLFLLLIVGIEITAQNTLVIQTQNLHEPIEIALFQHRDTICKQKILKKKTKIDYKHPTDEVIKMMVDGKKYYLLPKKKTRVKLVRSKNIRVDFHDKGDEIYNTAKREYNVLRAKSRKLITQWFRDTTLTQLDKELLNEEIHKQEDYSQEFIYEYFLSHAPSVASLFFLKEIIEYKSYSKAEIITLLHKVEQSRKIAKDYKNILTKINHLTDLKSYHLNDSIYQISLPTKEIPISANKTLLYFVGDKCRFSREEMQKLDSLAATFKKEKIDIIILDKSEIGTSKDICSKNEWQYHFSPNLFDTDFSYQLWINATPTGIFIENNVIKNMSFRIKKDFEELLK